MNTSSRAAPAARPQRQGARTMSVSELQIQTALKNAGYYTGTVDGKKGPQTKKAIEDFQKANSLPVDGKVGPKTWSALSKYVNPEPKPARTGKKR